MTTEQLQVIQKEAEAAAMTNKFSRGFASRLTDSGIKLECMATWESTRGGAGKVFKHRWYLGGKHIAKAALVAA